MLSRFIKRKANRAPFAACSHFSPLARDYLSFLLFTAVVGGCFFEEGVLFALSLGCGKATDKPLRMPFPPVKFVVQHIMLYDAMLDYGILEHMVV